MGSTERTHTLTVAETLKNNPIGKLQEMHLLDDEQRGSPPYYNLVEQSGDDHNPVFVIEANFRGKSSRGTGPSKQLAKTYAAANLLREIIGEEEAKSSITLDLSQVCITENSVGNLQEFCCVKGLEHPWYEEVSALGPAHNRNFSMTCSIGRICERGTGPNKKTAKRECAAKVHSQLIRMNPEELQEFEDPEVQENRKKRAEILEREEKEEEEKRRQEIEEGKLVVDGNIGTWGEVEVEKQIAESRTHPPKAQESKNSSSLKEVSGWEDGEAMYEGDAGTWGVQTADDNLSNWGNQDKDNHDNVDSNKV